MVRRSFTAILERNATFDAAFETEPYEAAWASEARCFVRVLEMDTSGPVRIAAQLSPDGLFWCDEGHALITVEGPGLHTFSLRDFGHWLRFRAEFPREPLRMKVMIYLVLKE
ncbi:hypothetical protein [uncultured Paludibaculum sp.]|uniref:hypothetical protein n=1 Tax=uncultured Paludibaculum sp. TaxID=1765020 RepID=UPI002AABA81D|nr:hypothetical protein [uncultured Paludibaculum sp.]